MLNVGPQLDEIITLKRWPKSRHMIKTTPDCPDVDLEPEGFVPDLLWGEVQRCPDFASLVLPRDDL